MLRRKDNLNPRVEDKPGEHRSLAPPKEIESRFQASMVKIHLPSPKQYKYSLTNVSRSLSMKWNAKLVCNANETWVLHWYCSPETLSIAGKTVPIRINDKE